MASKPVTKSSSKKNVKPTPSKGASVKTATVKSTEKYSPTKKQLAPLHIAIAGNIGAGKTTLTSLLAKNMKWEAHYEDVDDNLYLNDFYEDMQRWSFNLQIYFLNSRFEQINRIRQSGKTIIQDRTIYEDAHIFAPNLHSMGL